jgi:protein tyrosine/serine phosphatase
MGRSVGAERHLEWEGCFNARDLGGLPAAGRRRTRHGAVVRSDSPAGLTEAGWAALWEHGVRTVVDLRNDDELDGEEVARPAGLTTVHLPLDGIEDREFWDEWQRGWQFGTPLYYRPHLERFPERSAAAIAAIAQAPPGGVLVHCVGGRDRTGQISMLLLSLAGVAPEDIAADYELSGERLTARCARRKEPDQQTAIDRFLAESGTSLREAILTTLESLDVEYVLRGGGLTDEDLDALRIRLLEPAT